MADPAFLTSSDVAAGAQATAAQYNALRADIIQARLPVIFTLNESDLYGSQNNYGVYTDDFDYFAYVGNAATDLKVKDMRSGGDYEERAVTSDWAAADGISGIAKIGAFLYVLLDDIGLTENRVYRFDPQDLATGGTLMTATGGLGDGTSRIDLMISDGTDLYFNNNGGDTATSKHLWERWSISGTTLTEQADITCGATSADFDDGATMDHAGNFYGLDSLTSAEVRRFNSSGTLQATQSKSHGNANSALYTIEGQPYFVLEASTAGIHTFHKLALLP